MTSKEMFKMSTPDKNSRDKAVRLALTSDQPICQTARNLAIKEVLYIIAGGLTLWIMVTTMNGNRVPGTANISCFIFLSKLMKAYSY